MERAQVRRAIDMPAGRDQASARVLGQRPHDHEQGEMLTIKLKGSPGLLLMAAVAVVASLLALVVTPASARIAHPFEEPFGSVAQPAFTGAAATAVAQSSGDVLVMDLGTNTVSRYHADGSPADFSALGTNVIDGQGVADETPQGGLGFASAIESQIAVDNSGGATDGDIYVTQSSPNVVNVFADSGQYLGQLKGPGSAEFSEACGVAVDSAGAVYVGDYVGGIHKFVPSADPVTDGDHVASFATAANEPCTLAAGAGPSAGSLFAAEYGGAVSKLDSTTGALDYVVDNGPSTMVAVDSATGHVFVGIEAASIRESDASGASPTLSSSIVSGKRVEGFAVNGASGRVYVASPADLDVFGPLGTIPDVVTNLDASGQTKSTAVVSGTVDPDGVPLQESQGCYFEYGTTDAYGKSAPCVESAAEIGEGTEPVSVHALLSGLDTFAAYHFRLVAANSNGRSPGADATFVTGSPDLPSSTTDASGVGPVSYLATLNGRVNPNGFEVTDCRFVYGTTSSYGHSTPCEQPLAGIGSGSGDRAVTATTEPLEPNTTYHFRLRSSNPGGVGQGKDRTFTTPPAPADGCSNAAIRAAQGIGTLLLPGCMALEQVSPPSKGNQPASRPTVSASGERVLFFSLSALGSTPAINGLDGDKYVASRDDQTGWSTEGTNAPVPFEGASPQASFSPDLAQWFQLEARPELRYVAGGLGAPVAAVSPLLTNLTGTATPAFQGASADRKTVYFKPEGSGSFLSGDPQVEGPGQSSNVYVAATDGGGDPSLSLLARDRDGRVWGANCGVRLGGISGGNGNRNQGAISPDGRLVYLSARAAQPPSGPCSEGNKMRILARVETPTGPEIGELIQAECTACDPTDGDDLYQGASVDQSKVYFTSTRQLTDSDHDVGSFSCEIGAPSPGCDLYLYDSTRPAGQRLTQVSAGDQTAPTPGAGAAVYNSIAAISADGSHVYFAANGVLTTHPGPEGDVATAGNPNFYAWDAATEKTSFIGRLAANDGGFLGSGLWGDDATWRNGAYPVPIEGVDADGTEVGGDGHILVFKSRAPLTAADDDGGFTDVFRYDAWSGSLERVSRAVSGVPDDQPFAVLPAVSLKSEAPGTDYAEVNRQVSEDGETVAFTTAAALLPGDVNGFEDVYMWRHGRLYRLPGSARDDPRLLQAVPMLSHDGSTIAYHGSAQLLRSDGDGAADVYVARVGGGFASTPPPPTCEGEACQGSPGAPPPEPEAASGSFSGRGNLRQKQPRTKCGKGKVRRHKKCVTKRGHRGKKHRRDSSNHRGAKR